MKNSSAIIESVIKNVTIQPPPKKKPVVDHKSQQVIHYLSIKKLKGIHNLEKIDFDEKPLTALLGPNGCGKSTILHALACCYKPPILKDEVLEDYQFSKFFTPTTDATWINSKFSMHHTYRSGEKIHEKVETKFSKEIDRWSPRYSNRIDRYVKYIGIKSCVPKIEEEKHKNPVSYQTKEHVNKDLIIRKLGVIFNRNYEALNLHITQKGKKYSGLRFNGINYSALAMGAGEQRVIEILSTIFKAPKYGLILIDEIDLLLHTSALVELIKIIHQKAKDNSLQIIFTTHREAIIELEEMVSIKHLHTIKTPPLPIPQSENPNQNPLLSPPLLAPTLSPPLLATIHPPINYKTFCLSNTTPDAIRRLTGKQIRNLEIFVEDITAKAIVNYELSNQGLKKDVDITIYGASYNCFVLSAGLILHNKHDITKQLFLLDGDVNCSDAEISKHTNSVLTGTESYAEARRAQCIAGIQKLLPIDGANKTPEAQIHRMIKELPSQGIEEEDEIINIAKDIEIVNDDHIYFTKIFEIMNYEKPQGCDAIIRVASKSPLWPQYVKDLRNWISQRKNQPLEN